MSNSAFGYTTHRFDALIEEFTQALERDPGFRPLSQKGRVRCDRCGVYHPGAECARCQQFLEDAQALIRQKQRAQRSARVRQRHEQRRSETGYMLHHEANRVRRVLRRWRRALQTPSNMLHLALAGLILLLWAAVVEARSGLFWLGVAYACIGRALVAWHAHTQLCRLRPYECWHRVGVRGKPFSSWVHWSAFASLFGLTAWQASRAIADIATPAVTTKASRATFWTSALDWDTWTQQGTQGNRRSAALTLASPSTPHVTSKIDLARYGEGQRFLALSPDGLHLYIASPRTSAVLELNTKTNKVERLFSVSSSPRNLAVAPNGECLLVTHPRMNLVTKINLKRNVRLPNVEIAVGQIPISLAFTPDSKSAYISNRGDGTISELSLASNSVIRAFDIGTMARELAMTSQGDMLVANTEGNKLQRFDTRRNVQKLSASIYGMPWSVTAASDGSFALVSCQAEYKLYRVDLKRNSVKEIRTLFHRPEDIELAPDKSCVYVTLEDTLLCLRPDTGEVLASLSLSGNMHGDYTGPQVVVGHDSSYAYTAMGGVLYRIEGRATSYVKQGVACTTFDMVAQTAQSKDRDHFALRKRDELQGGTLSYYVASGLTRQKPAFPANARLTEAQAWKKQGWQPLQWQKDVSLLSIGQNRYCHIAVVMTTPTNRVSPHLKSLALETS